MALDLVLRAQTPAVLAYAIAEPDGPFSHLGIQFPRDENDAEILNPDNWPAGEWRLGPDVFYHYIRPNGLMVVPGSYDENGDEITPPELDPACWLLMRIIRGAYDADHEDDPTQDTDPQPDRWRQSKSKRRLKAMGTQVDWNGVRTWQHKYPKKAPPEVRRKTIQIMRGSELAGLNIFPHFMGGGYF